MTDRQGAEIDYCRKCRCVWLDRGEMGRLSKRSMGSMDRLLKRSYDHEDDYRDRRNEMDHKGRHTKRESWLSRLLDFD